MSPAEVEPASDPPRKARGKRQPFAALLLFMCAAWGVGYADSSLDPADADVTLDGQALACYARDHLRYMAPVDDM